MKTKTSRKTKDSASKSADKATQAKQVADAERVREEFDEAWGKVIDAALVAGLITHEELDAYYDARDFEMSDLQENDRHYRSPHEIAGPCRLLGPRTTALRFLFRALLFHDPCWKEEPSICCCREGQP